jgi:hypothetical protein
MGVLVEAWKVCAQVNNGMGDADPRTRSRRLWMLLSSPRLNPFSSAGLNSEVRSTSNACMSNADGCLDKHVLSEDEKKTQEYDALAFRYVSYGAIPCLAGYTIYSLIYGTHRGWYSFVLSTLTSFVYMFGFVSEPACESADPLTSLQAQLIPQLIINYKLKVCGIVGRQTQSHLTPHCGTERGPHADEGNDIQDTIHRG